MPKSVRTTQKKDVSYTRRLNRMKNAYLSIEERHRDSLYNLMAKAMPVILALRTAEAKGKRPVAALKVSGEEQIPLAVMRYIMGVKPKNKSKAKMAAKYARALVYAHDVLEIGSKELAVEIKKRGGIERLARDAARARSQADEGQDNDAGWSEEFQGQRSASTGAASKNQSGQRAASGGNGKEVDSVRVSAGNAKSENGKRGANDNWPRFSMRIAPGRKEQLSAAQDGDRLRLIVVMDGGFKITKVRPVAKKPGVRRGGKAVA